MPSRRQADNDFELRYYRNFSGGINYYSGPRQVKDTESPNAINCDFKGASGVGGREGYTEIGSVTDDRTAIYGLSEFNSASTNQLIKFASDGTDIELYHSTGGAWTEVSGTTWTDENNIETVQGGSKLYIVNGTSNVMREWNGSAIGATSNGTKCKYLEYYDKRIWGVDETSTDTLNFSQQSSGTLGDFTGANAGTVTFQPGSGVEITGIKKFKDYLYVFLENAIYRLSPASAANTFTVELVTSSVGCVSHRSIVQVEEDLYFAGQDGIYSIGEVANYVSVRTTNKSLRVQTVYEATTEVNKRNIVGAYFNFKYHLFYSLFGGANDSVLVYDIRYQAWQDWRNIAAQDAHVTKGDDTTGERGIFFGTPTTGEVFQLHKGTSDNGTAITSTWFSKSFDEDVPDMMKLYFDHTFVFGDLGGSVDLTIIFNDSQTTFTQTVSQQRPQGGFGRDAFGKKPFGDATNTVTVTSYTNQPLRAKVKGQKFSVQYKVESTGQWRLDTIANSFQRFSHFKFPASLKLN